MASKKYYFDALPYPVVTDMVWGIATGVNSQGQYKNEFKPLFDAYTNVGVIDKVGTSNVQVGVVDNRTAINDSASQSLALLLKNGLHKNETLKKAGHINLYFFPLKDGLAYVLGLMGQAILIDQTVSLGGEHWGTDKAKLINHISDILFANESKIAVFKPQDESLTNEDPQGLAALIESIVSEIQSVEAITEFTGNIENLIDKTGKGSHVFLKNVESFRSAKNGKQLVSYLLVALVAFGAWYWYSENEKQKEAQKLAQIEAAQKRAQELEAQQLAREARRRQSNSTEPNDLDRMYLLKQERLNKETEWLSMMNRSSGSAPFYSALKKIRETVIETAGWKTKEVSVAAKPNFKLGTLELTYFQKLVREDTSTTINDLANVYKDVNGSLEGNSAFNQKTHSIDLSQIQKQPKINSALFDVITLMQKFEHDGKIKAWSLGHLRLPPPEPIDAELVDLLEQYSTNDNRAKSVSENSWITEIKSQKLIVSGEMTDVIESVARELTKKANTILERVTYNTETNNTMVEVTIYEIQ